MQSKIFGIGLPKTGTTSLYAALYYLGYRAGTYRHMARLGMGEWFQGDFTIDYLIREVKTEGGRRFISGLQQKVLYFSPNFVTFKATNHVSVGCM